MRHVLIQSGYWTVIDSNCCPWSEVYLDGSYTDENRVRSYFDVEHRPNANSRTVIVLAEPQDHSLKPAFSLAAIVHVTFLCVCLTNQKLAF